uniref:Regulator of microtubule dynamics protein 1 n=1 Tax=Globodera rostochiensis TaxID=31243 RepID=A0A914GU93_GLORO
MMLEHFDRLHETGKHSEAYDELVKANRESDPEFLWRLARACHQMASLLEPKNPKKKEFLDEAHRYATAAYEMREDEFNVVKWMAAVTGSRTDFLATKERIEQGNLFKDLLNKALAINPEETTLLHMRGRFAYSVAGLSWLERKAASALYGNPPEGTYDEAIADFLAVTQHKPEWLENLLFLGKAYLAKGDKKSALLHLEKAVAANSCGDENVEEESEYLKEAKQLDQIIRRNYKTKIIS